ncbi:MAG TPA: hypothetical protein VMU33_03065 [Burkholderiaceae bacterium]|nr:hypothetical protein [Burkholderiaceae bacterium]
MTTMNMAADTVKQIASAVQALDRNAKERAATLASAQKAKGGSANERKAQVPNLEKARAAAETDRRRINECLTRLAQQSKDIDRSPERPVAAKLKTTLADADSKIVPAIRQLDEVIKAMRA